MANEQKHDGCCSGHHCSSEHTHGKKTLTVLESAAAVASDGTAALSGKAIVYSVHGMDCSSCAKSLERHMRTLPAVKDVSVNFSTGKCSLSLTVCRMTR